MAEHRPLGAPAAGGAREVGPQGALRRVEDHAREPVMTRRVPIQMNVANALQWLGNLYRNPADAIKEHVSNAFDEHLKAIEGGKARDRCTVEFRIEKRQVDIEYRYGMTQQEFASVFKRIVDSAMKNSNVTQ